YRAILAADRASAEERSGHGNALAQAYNHIILPLANLRDKRTQVRWGLTDFRRRFGREPEGMWLPECAVDDETLEVLAEEGVRFTVLAPSQARRVRDIPAPPSRDPEPRAGAPEPSLAGTLRGAEPRAEARAAPAEPLLKPAEATPEEEPAWTDVDQDKLDTTRPYRWFSRAHPGRHVDIFFYNRWIAQGVAFEGLLHDGARFAKRLIEPVAPGETPQLIHVATDGESYGHHHRWGNMALSFALRRFPIETEVRLTNYGEFLALFPPAQEVQLHPVSSWSCFHGVARWADDCGCKTGGRPEWHQRWRKPLRAALDWLAGELDALFERRGRELFRDPWAARDAYIGRVLDLHAGATHRFLAEHAAGHLAPAEAETALKLCEMQRHRMLMYTSCGWFFSDISGTEATQVLKYAARAIDLAEELGGAEPRVAAADPEARLQKRFQDLLEECPANHEKLTTGAAVYRNIVRPLHVDLERAAAHFSILDHFERAPTSEAHYAFEVKRHAVRRLEKTEEGIERSLTVARLELRHFLTLDHGSFTVAVHHRGRREVECWLKRAAPEESRHIEDALAIAFESASEAEFLAKARAAFGPVHRGLDSLFTDERRKWIAELGSAIPGRLSEAAQGLRASWRETLRRLREDPGSIADAIRGLHAVADAGVCVDRLPDAALASRRLAEAFWAFAAGNGRAPSEMEGMLRGAQAAGLHLDLWELQAAFWLWKCRASATQLRAAEGLGELLNFSPAPPPAAGKP
ncbi:MAG: DUF3536 domain-containing protein, partial [Elusimicrobia bacterium]|nr:DUF3536 domain-containing protein [Elusimicrobiota bacterium]